MTVSFTGVSNIIVSKGKAGKYPKYEMVAGKNSGEQLLRKTDVMKLDYTITNDQYGNDIDIFNEAVNKGLALSGEKIKDTSKPANVTILVKHFSYPQEELKPAETQFVVNNTLVPLNKNSDLAIYSYMGQLTRGMTKRTDLDQKKKDCLNEMNSYINDEALKFIERKR